MQGEQRNQWTGSKQSFNCRFATSPIIFFPIIIMQLRNIHTHRPRHS